MPAMNVAGRIVTFLALIMKPSDMALLKAKKTWQTETLFLNFI